MAIILASQSPRRRELLMQMGLTEFEVCPAQGEEKMDETLSPRQLVEQLSLQKAQEIVQRRGEEHLVIAADTIVSIDGRVLGKPQNEQMAREMLQCLSGREHTVYTGITVCRNGLITTQSEKTKVRFYELSAKEIDQYIATGEPMDKAGSYGIQNYGALFVAGIEGDYFNVVGLPIGRLHRILLHYGVDVLSEQAEKRLNR